MQLLSWCICIYCKCVLLGLDFFPSFSRGGCVSFFSQKLVPVSYSVLQQSCSFYTDKARQAITQQREVLWHSKANLMTLSHPSTILAVPYCQLSDARPCPLLCHTLAIRKQFIFVIVALIFFQINEPPKRSSMSELPWGRRRKRREMDAFWQQKAIELVQPNEISLITASLLGLPQSCVCFPSAQGSTSLEADEPSWGGFVRHRETHFHLLGNI